MREATDYSIFYAHSGQRDAASLLLSNLLSLMQRIQTSIRFNDLASDVSLEDDDLDGDRFILDDLTAHCAMANAALNVCHTILGNAFSRLQLASNSKFHRHRPPEYMNQRCVLVGGLPNA
jgi:hypothetical protein